MVKLFRTEMTASGRPVLLQGEVERGMLDKVDLLFYGAGGVEEHPSDEYKDGYVVLTNYRLIWVASRSASLPFDGVPCHLPLPAVSGVEHKGGMLVKNARVKVMVRVDSSSYPTVDARNVARLAPLKIVCKGPSPDTLHTQLQAALQRQAWGAAPLGVLQQLLPVPQLAPEAGGAVAGRVTALPPGQRQLQGPSSSQLDFQPDWAMVQGLCAIGYPQLHAVNAVVATRNAGVQQAVEWLLDHEGSPAVSQPSPYLPASRGGGSAAPAISTDGSGSFSNPLLVSQAGSGSSWGSQFSSVHSGPTLAGSGGSGATPAYQRQLSLGSVGVTGILRREQQRAAATESTMDQAFSDLQALMDKAEEMVQLAQYFREKQQQKAAAGRDPDATAASGDEEELDAETALDLVALGIASPVTRETAGSLYHQELARQLADFLKAPMERAGGLMPLPDVYCLYNRARGVELISPDDLLQAINLFPQVRAPFALREFASGVKVVQSASYSDDAVCSHIAKLVQPQQAQQQAAQQAEQAGAAPGGITSSASSADVAAVLATLGPAITRTEVAISLGVPVAVAGEHLRLAEARGVVCRDESPEGLLFYRNFFADLGLMTAA